MNPLKLYLAETGESVEVFATKARQSTSAIYEYLRGTRKPRRSRYKQLVDATGGKITAEQLIQYFESEEGAL